MRIARSKRCSQLQEGQLDLARRLPTAASIGQATVLPYCLGMLLTLLLVVFRPSAYFLESWRVAFCLGRVCEGSPSFLVVLIKVTAQPVDLLRESALAGLGLPHAPSLGHARV